MHYPTLGQPETAPSGNGAGRKNGGDGDILFESHMRRCRQAVTGWRICTTGRDNKLQKPKDRGEGKMRIPGCISILGCVEASRSTNYTCSVVFVHAYIIPMAGPRLLSFFLFPLHGIQTLYDRSSFLLQLTWTRNRRAISYFHRVFLSTRLPTTPPRSLPGRPQGPDAPILCLL